VNRSELRIRTPEGISFAYQLAGPVSRCLAWGVDLLVLVSVVIAAAFGIGWIAKAAPDLAGSIFVFILFAMMVGYGITLEWLWRGQTIGKKMLRLRVMDADGLPLRFHQIVMRNLLRVVDQMPGLFVIGPGCYLVGGLCCLLSRKGQRLGDLAAGTIVVHHRRTQEPDLEQLLGTKFNSLRGHLHLCARLRQRTSPDEARLALQALVRRDEILPEARVRLFADLAEHLKKHADFPPELLESLPDEQFVRNVVDILFRREAPIQNSRAA